MYPPAWLDFNFSMFNSHLSPGKFQDLHSSVVRLGLFAVFTIAIVYSIRPGLSEQSMQYIIDDVHTHILRNCDHAPQHDIVGFLAESVHSRV